MTYSLAMIVLGVFGAVLVLIGLAFFRRPGWLLGWFKGMLVIVLLAAGAYAGLIAFNLSQYRSLSEMDTVATVGVTKGGPQAWTVRLETPDEKSVEVAIRGDQWQVDARIIRFKGPIAWMGVAPGYRLERLSGRYVSLEQERTATRTLVDLAEGEWPDIWQLDQSFNLPFIDGIYGSATYMPLADGAIYDVRLSGSGLVAVPANNRARAAIDNWGE
ncbi:multidrug transporter [Marinobacter salicampi]|uniref:multidrug transporter n=1 Tax=Marinobacter salicampi TaxID=435907 RepID=UPI001409B6D4|nr:multidrug transporter [Marinobacter salicampi]